MNEHTIEKVLNRARSAMVFRGYRPRTVTTYLGWIRRFLQAHGDRHPAALGETEVVRYLTDLTTRGRIGPSTQGQVTSALLFLFRDVIKRPIDRPVIARRHAPRRLPVVLTREEITAVITKLAGVDAIVAMLLYGSGLRLMECLTLRVKDIDLGQNQIVVRSGKGAKDRMTMIGHTVAPRLERQLARVQKLHGRDLTRRAGYVPLPDALARKYPNAMRELKWQFVFPSRQLADVNGCPGKARLHRHPSAVQRAVRRAADQAGITKRVTCHTFRHSFATHLLVNGYDIRTIQELMGHSSVRTTMIYTHVLNREGRSIRSPVDYLDV